MKIKRNNSTTNKKKIAILASTAVILFIIGGSVSAYMYNQNSSKDSNTTPTQSESDVKQAEDLQNNADNKDNSPNTDPPAPTTTNEATGKTVVSMTASADVSNGTLYIRGGVNNLVADGSCYVLLTGPNAESIRKDTSLLQNASTTDCKTIAINTAELSKGRWTYSLIYQSTNAEGKTDEAQINI